MTRAFVINSIDEWLALPELTLPKVADEASLGDLHEVLKVGFLAAPKDKCDSKKIEVTIEQVGKAILPTAVIRDADGTPAFYRLPTDLAEWALGCCASAQQLGRSFFPCHIEFGVLRGRAYAEIADDEPRETKH